MGLRASRRRLVPPWSGLFTWVIAACTVVPSLARCEDKPTIEVLRVGTSGTLGLEDSGDHAFTTMQGFIKTQTGLKNEMKGLKDWRELADKMVSREVHIGVFQGFEFAWAKERQPKLASLVLAVNVYRYPTAYIVARKSDPAKDFAGLKGHILAIAKDNSSFLRLYVERQCQANGKKPEEYFSRVTTADNIEDGLDDLVDGVVTTVSVDRAGLESYKRRKPGRFTQLKAIAQSEPFPPVVVAYYNQVLDKTTLDRFRDGLVDASHKEGGKELLVLLRLTSFDPIPADFEQVLAETLKTYPPPAEAKK